MWVVRVLLLTLCITLPLSPVTGEEDMSRVIINTKKFEGLKLRAYKDTMGRITVGYGHNMERALSKRIFLKAGIPWRDVFEGRRSIMIKEAEKIFQYDMAVVESEIRDVVSSFDQHPQLVQTILKDLLYNLGKTKLLKFEKTIAAFNAHDYNKAADELTDSLWYRQVGLRSRSIVGALRELATSSR